MAGPRKPLYGVGINDADYFTQKEHRPDGSKGRWICPFYSRWCGMLERVYSKNNRARYPTSEGNSVSNDWLYFTSFKFWMEEQPWDRGELHLDKDILFLGNKHYSKETCAFIPHYLNSLLLRRQRFRGEYPLGVTRRSGKNNYKRPLIAQLNILVDGVQKHVGLGYFSDPLEAHKAWQRAKADNIYCVLQSYLGEPSFQQNVYNSVEFRAVMLRQQADNGVETKVL